MEFSVAASLGSHVLPTVTLERRTINCQLFCTRQHNNVGFNFPNLNKVIHRGIFASKQDSIDFDERKSPNEVREEIKKCYDLINRLGRGVLYLGSSRLGPGHSHYVQAQELAKEIANLLDCTSWSGAGPGLMDAVTQGALIAGKPVGGFKIGKEAGEWKASNYHPYHQKITLLAGNLPPWPDWLFYDCNWLLKTDRVLTFNFRFFSARKHGLVDAIVRNNSFDKTAVVALPGGIGTLDEVFEILALIQLERIGSKLPVPFMLMNYDSFYSKLLEFLNVCEEFGTVSEGEVAPLWKVCNSNSEALAYLADFYCISPSNTNKNATELYSMNE